jgi:2'-5' RNA ligase
MPSAKSTLVVLVPEAEAAVRSFRNRYDPSAAAGMPAHITLLYPFKPPAAIGEAVLDRLRDCCAGFAPFDFALTTLQRFAAEALYLMPEPNEPFRRLTLAIWQCYPDAPPYGGRFATVVPHLTLAQITDDRRLAAIADEFAAAAGGRLPISAHAGSVALMDTRSGRWEIRTTFDLV